MSFRFRRKESVPKGLRRVAEERIESALSLLKDHHRPESVHAVRKDIKKVRAVLRLVRARIPSKAYRRQTDLLRKAADRLAGPRDAYVKGAALRNLSKHLQNGAGGKALRPIRNQLRADLNEAEAQFAKKKRVREVKHLLKRIPKELERLNFDAKGWKAIAKGVEKTFTLGQEAYQMARQKPSPEHLHTWRKRVKDLWYQIRLVQPSGSDELRRLASQLKELSEFLGDDHDLFVLLQSAALNHSDQRELFGSETLTAMIEQRRRQLQTNAFKLGQPIYTQEPAEFCTWLAQQWHAWRKGRASARRNSRTAVLVP